MATKDAALALVMAHVELAKAEAGQIAGEVGRVAALGALAIALVIFAVFLLVIGASLWLGEWLLGSMGWGVLHGFLLFIAVAMTAVLGAIGIAPRRLGGAFAVGVLVAVVVGVGITLGYVTWMALMGIDVSRTGIDVEALKNRFYPVQTIDTSKETLEWLQKRMPPGIGS
jgi:hypothetical protein